MNSAWNGRIYPGKNADFKESSFPERRKGSMFPRGICCFSRVSRIEKYASRLMTSRRRTVFSLRSPLRRLIPCPVFRLPALFRPFSGLVQNRQVPFSCARRGKGSGMASSRFRIRSAAPPEVGGSAFQDSGNHRTDRFCRNNSRISGTRPPPCRFPDCFLPGNGRSDIFILQIILKDTIYH